MFYTKTIHVIEEVDGHMDDEWGVWVPGELAIVKSIECDVQPVTQKEAMEDFGYTKQVKYRVYADLDPLFEIGTLIKYKEQNLKIVQMKEWDDYLDMLVAASEQVVIKMAERVMTVNEAIADVTKKRNKAMEEILLMVEADAKMNVGVDTGLLRRSITHNQESTKDKVLGTVGSNVEYAFFHSLNNPYLENAVDQNKENIKRKISEVMNQ